MTFLLSDDNNSYDDNDDSADNNNDDHENNSIDDNNDNDEDYKSDDNECEKCGQYFVNQFRCLHLSYHSDVTYKTHLKS